ncbi:MAG TPA: MBL fold metallo-hydrolase [Thermomicrobiales bacterium]|nr:MBL fold metallo-hydrolase [Thermomicrobiales bacterium]
MTSTSVRSFEVVLGEKAGQPVSDQTESTQVTWFGHSTVLIRMGETTILTDPLLRGRAAHLRRRVPLLEEDWPAAVDAILISHLHLDHCDLPTLRRLGRHIPLLVPVGAGTWLRGRGFTNVVELPVGADHVVESVVVTAVPAEHPGRRWPLRPDAETIGFLVRGPKTFYFAGDTELFDGMGSLGVELDVALIPVWGWGRSLGTGHMDPARAAEALRLQQPRIAIPIHWGTLHPYGTAIRDKRFLEDPPNQFAELARSIAPSVDVRIMQPGETIVIE